MLRFYFAGSGLLSKACQVYVSRREAVSNPSRPNDWVMLRNLNLVTILGKPYYLPHMYTHFGNLI